MAEIKPFRGIIYNQERVKIQDVVSPPYDVISEEQRKQLANKSPYNIVHLILGNNKDWTKKAGNLFNQWLKENILIQETNEALYFYTMEYKINSDKKCQRGFIARLRIEPFEKGIVLPHEKTFTKVVAERLRLLRATEANFCQIYGIYDEENDKIITLFSSVTKDSSPLIEVTKEDVTHKIYRVTNKEIIKKIQNLMLDKKIIIADGHHRYRTALAYKEEMERQYPHLTNAPFNYVSVYLSSFKQINILPIHRLLPASSLSSFSFETFLKKLTHYFEIEKYSEESDFWRNLRQKKGTAIGVYCFDSAEYFFLLQLKKADWCKNLPDALKGIDTIVLNQLVFKDILGFSESHLNQKDFIHYLSDCQKAITLVKEGEYKLVFLLRPLKPQDLKTVVFTSCLLPRKSTYFYPKLLSGLVINSLRL